MKKLMLLPLIGLIACGGNNKTGDAAAPDSVAVAVQDTLTQTHDTVIVQHLTLEETIQRDQIAFLDEFYKNGWYDNPARLKASITKKMRSQLIRANEYEDGGMAFWLLYRPCCQDSGKPVYMGAVNVGPNTYVVTVKDSAYGGGGCGKLNRIRLKLVDDNGSWKIDSFKVLD